MKKLISLFLCLCLFCGCAAKEQTMEQDGFTFTDDLDRSITIEEPQRVACLLGSFAQIWQLAGGEVGATADDAWDDMQLELAEDTVNLGNTKQLSLELLLDFRPDFILASTNTRQNVEWQETLDAAQIPTAYFDVADFDDYLRLLEICCGITGRSDLYEKNGLAVQKEIDAVLADSAKRIEEHGAPTVLSIRASASSVTVKNSQDNVLGEMLHSLGCENIADSNAMLLENLSMEYILESDPDFVFFVQRGDDEEGMKAYVQENILSHPLWAQLSAVKEGKVFFMEKNLYNLKPNHRWGEAYEKLEAILSENA
jgi:iron complex transport system substrate-binding protein